MKTLLITTIVAFVVIGNAPSLSAETPSLMIQYRNRIELNKAKNLARQAAEKANGGLSEYRAEPKMHSLSTETNHEEIAPGMWKFTFRGKRPQASDYTIESVVIVDTNSDTVTIEYNGKIR